MSKKIFIVFAAAFFVVGCAGKATRVDPTVVSTSYDYTKPADIAAQSKPVWVLPIINKGWIPARVDPKTGDWISGHYQATIVQDGYWATQEEAELAGRPYIIAGESSAIVPTPVTNGPTATGGGGGELDIANMQGRLSNVERTQQSLPTAPAEEQVAALSAQVQALSQNVPSNYQSMAPTGQTTKGYTGGIMVQGTPPPPTAQNPSLSTGNEAAGAPNLPPTSGSTIVIPPMPAGTVYEIPSNSQLPSKLTVHYLSNNQVELEYRGKKKQLQLGDSNPKVKVNIPRTVNLDEPPSSASR